MEGTKAALYAQAGAGEGEHLDGSDQDTMVEAR